MNETNETVGKRLRQLAKTARDSGLWLLGFGMYLSILVLIVLVLLKGVKCGKLSVAEAVFFSTYASTAYHWILFAFRI